MIRLVALTNLNEVGITYLSPELRKKRFCGSPNQFSSKYRQVLKQENREKEIEHKHIKDYQACDKILLSFLLRQPNRNVNCR